MTDDRMDQATPRPWTAHNADRGAYVYAPDARYESLPGNPSPVKVAWCPMAPMSHRAEADAALIVAAVNDYDRLRAIEAAARAVDQAGEERDLRGYPELQKPLADLRALLAPFQEPEEHPE